MTKHESTNSPQSAKAAAHRSAFMTSLMPSRLLAVSGFIGLVSGTTLNLVFGAEFPGTIVPYPNIVTPCVNGLCTVMCLALIFMPRNIPLLIAILTIQSVYDVLTGFDMLGLFLFMLINLILFCKGFFKRKAGRKFALIASLWFLLLLSLLSFGLERFIFAAAVTLFMACAFVYVYYLLFDKLSSLLPEFADSGAATVQLPAQGSVISLKGLGLSPRQQKCVMACMRESVSYKQLGEQFCVSESAIKKDMKTIFDLFGVKNREALRLVLCRYELIE